ncbi:MAG: hypothetical protein PF447_04095 [Spirochaetaceae bacterium]|nr:hypothetical protein [Spirochaetaceae bacterium]
MTVSVGQTVMYEKFTGTAVKIDNEDHLVVHMGDLIAVID